MGIKVSNNAFATLAAGISNSATSITLTTGQGARFPTLGAGDYFYATLIDISNNLEIVKCTARSGDVLTVTRAQENTSARAYSTGDRIELRITAQTFVDAVSDASNLTTGIVPAAQLGSGTANNTTYLRGDQIWAVVEGVPAGTVIHVASNTAPTGYLKANGAEVSRSTYAALFSAIGTAFGSGNGSTTFNLPDLRGEFIRSWDDGRGVDSGRGFGSAQADAFKSHTHGLPRGDMDWNNGGGNGVWGANNGGLQTLAAGGNETRPRNVALLACIKF